MGLIKILSWIHTKCSRGSSVTTISRPRTFSWCKGDMFALDCVDIIHRCGAIFSNSGAQNSRSKKLVSCCGSSSRIRGWPGRDERFEDSGPWVEEVSKSWFS